MSGSGDQISSSNNSSSISSSSLNMEWVSELKESLLRAGDNLWPNYPIDYWQEDDKQGVYLRLWLALTKEEQKALKVYIKAFAKTAGARVQITFFKSAIKIAIEG